eukprot:2160-Heterococcus_DN1.PRE.1
MQSSAAAERFSSVHFSELLGVYPRVAVLCARAGNLPAAEQVCTRKCILAVAYTGCVLLSNQSVVWLAHQCSVVSFMLRHDSAHSS